MLLKQRINFLAMLLLNVLLAGCVNSSASYCELYSPIYFPVDTALDIQEKLTVLNEVWEEYCK
jgi:TRAP-type C4-dicarboxylate transport system permease large subunit